MAWLRSRHSMPVLIWAAVLAVALMTASGLKPEGAERWFRYGLLAVGVLCSLGLNRSLVASIPQMEPRPRIWLRNVGSLVVLTLAFLLIASAAGLNLSSFLLGGAIMGALVATAAQTTLANLFGGLTLLVAHPFRVGQRLEIRFEAQAYEGVVEDIGTLYTTLRRGAEMIRLPNRLLSSQAIVLDAIPVRMTIEVAERRRGTNLMELERALNAKIGYQVGLRVSPDHPVKQEGTSWQAVLEVRSEGAIDEFQVAQALLELTKR